MGCAPEDLIIHPGLLCKSTEAAAGIEDTEQGTSAAACTSVAARTAAACIAAGACTEAVGEEEVVVWVLS